MRAGWELGSAAQAAVRELWEEAGIRVSPSPARLGAEDLAKQPQAGGLFVAAPGVRGIAELPFAG